MTKRSRSTPRPSQIDKEWPHQVALPDDICVDQNYTLIRRFCDERGWSWHTRFVQAIWPNRKYVNMRIHCFADTEAAREFQAHFGGEWFSPKTDRENGRVRGAWRRQDEYRRVLTSGPLSVPKLLRE